MTEEVTVTEVMMVDAGAPSGKVEDLAHHTPICTWVSILRKYTNSHIHCLTIGHWGIWSTGGFDFLLAAHCKFLQTL